MRNWKAQKPTPVPPRETWPFQVSLMALVADLLLKLPTVLNGS
jgi:hypothetical protein